MNYFFFEKFVIWLFIFIIVCICYSFYDERISIKYSKETVDEGKSQPWVVEGK